LDEVLPFTALAPCQDIASAEGMSIAGMFTEGMLLLKFPWLNYHGIPITL
jgi:hypothetical protein